MVITLPFQRMEWVGDHLSLQSAGQILMKLSHPGSVFLLRVCWMAESEVCVSSLLCNSRQSINHVCVLLALRQGTWPSNPAKGKLCWKVQSSSHRICPDIHLGGTCLFLLEPYSFLFGFLFVQTEISKGRSHGPVSVHANVLGLLHELGWDCWRAPLGQFPMVGAWKAL